MIDLCIQSVLSPCVEDFWQQITVEVAGLSCFHVSLLCEQQDSSLVQQLSSSCAAGLGVQCQFGDLCAACSQCSCSLILSSFKGIVTVDKLAAGLMECFPGVKSA